MIRLRFLDQMLILRENNESIIKFLILKYPPETKVTILDEKGLNIIDILQINEIFDL
jgi:hypothetical protein